jgi:hypothetical protein
MIGALGATAMTGWNPAETGQLASGNKINLGATLR